MSTELEFVTTDELWGELKKRFQSCLFVGQDVRDHLQLLYGGYGSHCIGLARYAEKRLYDFIVNAPQPTPPPFKPGDEEGMDS